MLFRRTDLASAFERKRLEEVDEIPASRTSTLAALKNAPEAAGIEFIGTPDDGLGVRLRSRHIPFSRGSSLTNGGLLLSSLSFFMFH